MTKCPVQEPLAYQPEPRTHGRVEVEGTPASLLGCPRGDLGADPRARTASDDRHPPAPTSIVLAEILPPHALIIAQQLPYSPSAQVVYPMGLIRVVSTIKVILHFISRFTLEISKNDTVLADCIHQ